MSNCSYEYHMPTWGICQAFLLFFLGKGCNRSNNVVHFDWPDAGRDGLPGLLAALEK